MSHKIFISYRRFDTAGTAGRLHDGLNDAFGEERIFRDVHDIPAGVDFRDVLDEELKNCQIVLVLMGQHYTSVKDAAGNLRLHDPNDFVHIEVASAIRMEKIVIPVLVDGIGMPSPKEFPEPLKELVNYNAVVLSHDRWKTDVQVLVEKLEYHMGPRKKIKRPQLAGAPESELSIVRRSMGPIAFGGFVTLLFLIALGIAIGDEPEAGTKLSIDENSQPYESTDHTTYEAGFVAPVEEPTTQPMNENTVPEEYQETGNHIQNTGGYGLPTSNEPAETDYWGMEKKRSLEDQIIGVWEQTFPVVQGMVLRETFSADGRFSNGYQELYYNVVAGMVQMQGQNVYQVVSMNDAETEMELRDLQGGGLVKVMRRIQ